MTSRTSSPRQMSRTAAPATSAQSATLGTDHATAALILRIQLEDINRLLGARNNDFPGWEKTLLTQKRSSSAACQSETDRWDSFWPMN